MCMRTSLTLGKTICTLSILMFIEASTAVAHAVNFTVVLNVWFMHSATAKCIMTLQFIQLAA